MNRKVYVDVFLLNDKTGNIVPMIILWRNGMKYKIDRILQVKAAANLDVGGYGTRYTCLINGQTRQLYLEDYRWFMSVKESA